MSAQSKWLTMPTAVLSDDDLQHLFTRLSECRRDFLAEGQNPGDEHLLEAAKECDAAIEQIESELMWRGGTFANKC